MSIGAASVADPGAGRIPPWRRRLADWAVRGAFVLGVVRAIVRL